MHKLSSAVPGQDASTTSSTSSFHGPTSTLDRRKRKRSHLHPYLSGNFAPVKNVQPLTPCHYSGSIPQELAGGEYVRNGGNPVSNEDLGRDAHWFDGDGMLSGVSFTQTADGVQPEFVNQYILTDLYLSTLSSKRLRTPILPSIATLVNPLSSLYHLILLVFRTICLVILSRLPGSLQAIKKISVANTGILYHDGRALATCESGPPMRIALPGLETVGWYNGKKAEGEMGEGGPGFGGEGIYGFMREWTTAHPRVDPKTGELILFHSTFVPPYVHYSIIPANHPPATPSTPLERPTRLLNAPVPGVSSAKMMHDFGVSFHHTVIMDLPLSLDPLNLAKNKPVVSYDPTSQSRFGIFPRHWPQQIRWFKTKACCIFHTVNTWDEQVVNKATGKVEMTAVNMLACRLTSASLVFSAGDIAAPQPTSLETGGEEEQCRLYYYQFSLAEPRQNNIAHQFALSAIPFEFPSIREDKGMDVTKYAFGCSTSEGTFGAALGRAVKIDCLVKIDAETLIKRGRKNTGLEPITGCVDTRSVREVLDSTNLGDPISIFQLPPGWYAQEPRFVPRKEGSSEDDGWLLTYVFDESQLDASGECPLDAKSELWIIDAKDMKTIVARVHLTQRVPYGLHGNFFSEKQVNSQRPIETIRGIKQRDEADGRSSWWLAVRDRIENFIG
ncbi:putative lignostilbene dioxygenase [Cladophialophora carrionii]|uniref:Putative lignostilbene dioxygenase n=1 Tax=Cladophialophora carrionii TaxID=86049 RepID=A0A1C1CZA6_9EURO|nr:putative lignostilbene dioxygenase [Cladophialophora carrionii]